MCLHKDRLVALIGSAGVDVIAHNVIDKVQGIVLVEIVVPLKRIIRRCKSLEHTGLRVEIFIHRLGCVVFRSDKVLGAGRNGQD